MFDDDNVDVESKEVVSTTIDDDVVVSVVGGAGVDVAGTRQPTASFSSPSHTCSLANESFSHFS